MPNYPASTQASVAMPQNSQRLGLSCYNGSGSIVFLKLGYNASQSDYSLQILPGGYYEAPAPVYTGEVTFVCDSATTGGIAFAEW